MSLHRQWRRHYSHPRPGPQTQLELHSPPPASPGSGISAREAVAAGVAAAASITSVVSIPEREALLRERLATAQANALAAEVRGAEEARENLARERAARVALEAERDRQQTLAQQAQQQQAQQQQEQQAQHQAQQLAITTSRSVTQVCSCKNPVQPNALRRIVSE